MNRQIQESVTLTLEHYEKLKTSTRVETKFKVIELSELKDMRATLGISMEFVKKHTGIDKATISRIEHERSCRYQTVKKLYEFYQSQI